MQFGVDFYKKEDGICPIQQFLDSLSCKARAKVLRQVLILQNNGHELREPYSKYLEDGIFELRVKHSTMCIRVLYFFMVNQRIVLVNGFVKKAMKTPKNEMELAKKYRKEYLERRENFK